ncbi:hypothetical protein Tco_1217763 [Tanacetum coccineum]
MQEHDQLPHDTFFSPFPYSVLKIPGSGFFSIVIPCSVTFASPQQRSSDWYRALCFLGKLVPLPYLHFSKSHCWGYLHSKGLAFNSIPAGLKKLHELQRKYASGLLLQYTVPMLLTIRTAQRLRLRLLDVNAAEKLQLLIS